MNKQQMIDKAIKALGGVYPVDSSGLNYLIKSTINNSCWGEGKYEVYQYPDSISPSWQHICTRKEFEDRVEELNNMKKFEPKIGELCEATWGNKVEWHKCIVGYNITLREKYDNEWVEINYETYDNVEFRPIKTDKELTIEKAFEITEKAAASCEVTFLESLYDAGMLVTPKSKRC